MSSRRSVATSSARLRLAAVLASLSVLLLVTGVVSVTSASAQAACGASGPAGGAYTVTVCIASPDPSGPVTGPVTVLATATVTGASPGVQRLVFLLNGSDLVSEFQAPYTWTLDSTRWMDGGYSLQAYALMRDGFSTDPTTETVTFSNGITSPPVNNNTFSPTSGTTPAPGHPMVVAAVGDGAGGEPGEASVVNLISSWNPNLFLYLGDVYENGRPMEFNNWYGLPGAQGSYGQFFSITDPTIGNHEYVGSDISGYAWYWNNPPHYYSYNVGGWHVVSLDNISKFIGTTTSNANYLAETAWLSNDLASNNLACTLVYYHEPMFNVGPEGSATNTAGIWQILNQYHVTLVLNGHDHDYQRWVPLDASGNPSPGGVTEIVDGSGGHGHQAQVATDSRLASSDFTDFGALRLTLGSSGAAYQFITTSGVTKDSGSVACPGSGTDTTPPSQPQNLTATAVSRTQVQLSWSDSTDNVGVTSYDIYRNGSLLTSVPPPGGYLDQTAQPGTTYSYYVIARDAAGNSSQPSATTTVTTPTDSTLFFDGFETGDMSQWTTTTGMTVQTQTVDDGSYAAEATATGASAYAYKQLSQTWPYLYYSTQFNILSKTSGSVYLLRLRTASKGAIAAVYVSSTGKLGLRNDVTSTSTTSSTAVSFSAWHTLQLYGDISSGQVTVWLDGTLIGQLSGAQSLGTSRIGYLQLGDTSTSDQFTVAFDDVRADPLPSAQSPATHSIRLTLALDKMCG